MACCGTSRWSTRSCLRMWECDSIGATSNLWSDGHARIHTCNGGKTFWAIQEERDSGMKRTSHAAGSRPFTTISRFRWDYRPLPPQNSRADLCSQLEPGWALRGARLRPNRLAKAVCTASRNDNSGFILVDFDWRDSILQNRHRNRALSRARGTPGNHRLRNGQAVHPTTAESTT